MKVYVASCNPNFESPHVDQKMLNLLISLCHREEVKVTNPSARMQIAPMNRKHPLGVKLTILKENARSIEDADFVLAAVDNRDYGVCWEMGAAYMAHKQIIIYNHNGYYDIGEMFLMCSIGVVTSLEELASVLSVLKEAKTEEERGRAFAKVQKEYRANGEPKSAATAEATG